MKKGNVKKSTVDVAPVAPDTIGIGISDAESLLEVHNFQFPEVSEIGCALSAWNSCFMEFHALPFIYTPRESFRTISALLADSPNPKVSVSGEKSKSKVIEGDLINLINAIRNKTSPKSIMKDGSFSGMTPGTLKSLVGKIGGTARAVQYVQSGKSPELTAQNSYARIYFDMKSGLSRKQLLEKKYTVNMIQAVIRFHAYFE